MLIFGAMLKLFCIIGCGIVVLGGGLVVLGWLIGLVREFFGK